jgi:hypothetical protein
MTRPVLTELTIKGVNPLDDVLTFGRSGTMIVAPGVARFYWPFPVLILGVTASLGVAPTGAGVTIDLNKNGTTIFTTQGNRPVVPAGGFVTVTEAVPAVTTVVAGDYYTLDVDTIGSGVAGAELNALIRYRRV